MGKSSLRILIRSTFTAYLLTAVFLLALALGLYKFHLTESQVGLGVKAIYIFVCLVAGIIAGKMGRTRKFLWGLLAGAGYYVVLLLVSLVINRELGNSAQEMLLAFLMCAGSGMLGGMIS